MVRRLVGLTVCVAALAGCSKDFARLQGGVVGLDADPPDARTLDDMDVADAMDGGRPDAGDEPDGSVADAEPDAGEDACVLRRPPERPDVADGPSVPVRWYAMRSIALGVGETWRDIGYDLDGRCTTSDATLDEVECAPPRGFTPANDAPGGADNAFGQTVVPLLELVDENYPNELILELERGEHGVLIRIAEWNGTANDPTVDVALVDSTRGFREGADLSSTTELITPPRWDTTDEWLASQGSFAAGDIGRPIARDTGAYIVDDVMVAHPRDGTELRLAGSLTIVLPLDDAILTARFSGSRFELTDGVLAGRVALDAIYDMLPLIAYCPGTDAHRMFSTITERAADLRINPDAPASERCSAVSLAIGYTAVQANVRAIVPDRPTPDRCDGVNDDACSADCPTANDGWCDDGGNGSRRITCELGTDCADCGFRRG